MKINLRTLLIGTLLYLTDLNAQNFSEKKQRNAQISDYVMNLYWDKPETRVIFESHLGVPVTPTFGGKSEVS
jgi:hypothetical protein